MSCAGISSTWFTPSTITPMSCCSPSLLTSTITTQVRRWGRRFAAEADSEVDHGHHAAAQVDDAPHARGHHRHGGQRAKLRRLRRWRPAAPPRRSAQVDVADDEVHLLPLQLAERVRAVAGLDHVVARSFQRHADRQRIDAESSTMSNVLAMAPPLGGPWPALRVSPPHAHPRVRAAGVVAPAPTETLRDGGAGLGARRRLAPSAGSRPPCTDP
jgi:hypothetical protein